MKKILAVATFSALALVACGDSSSDSAIPTDGNASDDLFGGSWVSKDNNSGQTEVVTFTRQAAGTKIVKMKKYLTCSNNRYSTVEADVEAGARSIQINDDYVGTKDGECEAKIAKGNYGYVVTPTTLNMQSTSDEKVRLDYVRSGVYSCLMPNYLGNGQTCADYFNDSVPQSVCKDLGGGGQASTASCADRVNTAPLKICRINATTSSGKKLDFVLNFYNSTPKCDFKPGLVEELEGLMGQ